MNTLPAGELLELFLHFLTLSLLSIGGAMSTAPEMHRYFVTERGWLGDADFTTAVALAQAAPGPNVLFVPVLGFQAAGLPGAAAALVGILLPSTL
ncbi:MAG TPA: chromate transporter, partial [Thauera sp.]|nr:chromate transporter [Thauera sp.]